MKNVPGFLISLDIRTSERNASLLVGTGDVITMKQWTCGSVTLSFATRNYNNPPVVLPYRFACMYKLKILRKICIKFDIREFP